MASLCCACRSSALTPSHCLSDKMADRKVLVGDVFLSICGVSVRRRDDFICQKCYDRLSEAYAFRKKYLESQRRRAVEQIMNLNRDVGSTRKTDNTNDRNKTNTEQNNGDVFKKPKRPAVKIHHCDKCKFKTTYKIILDLHAKEKHNYSCKECNFSAARKYGVNRHTLAHDPDERIYSCKKCDYKTNRRDSLAKHAPKHATAKNYTCDLCDFATNYGSSLTLHALTHAATKKHACAYCDFKTNYKSVIYSHMLTHENVKKYRCDHCGHATNYKKNMVAHVSLHDNEKKFACNVCEFKTNYKKYLIIHKVLHNKENLFITDD